MDAKVYIKEAFYFLCDTTDLQKISVNAIIKKAGINRSTFYYYFEDKFDLMRLLKEEVLEEFFRLITIQKLSAEDIRYRYETLTSPEVFAACKHIKDNQKVFKIWFNDTDFIQRFSERMEKYLEQFSTNRMYRTFIAYGGIGYFKRWVEMNCPGSLEEISAEILLMSRHSVSTDQLKI